MSARRRMAEAVRVIGEREREGPRRKERRGMGMESEKRIRWERIVVTRRGRKEEMREVTAEKSLTGRPKKPWKTLWVMVARAERENMNRRNRDNKRSGKGKGKLRELVWALKWAWVWVWRRRMWIVGELEWVRRWRMVGETISEKERGRRKMTERARK
jgi:hypothetical protein